MEEEILKTKYLTIKISRRQFFFYIFVVAISYFVTRELSNNTKKFPFAFIGMTEGYIVGMGDSKKAPRTTSNYAPLDESGALAIYDKEYTLIKTVKLPFVPHSTIQNPSDLNQLIATQKFGDTAAIVNLDQEEVKLIKLSANSDFSGHGFFLPGTTNFALTVMNFENKMGEIHYYNLDGVNFKIHSTFGLNPHAVEVDQEDPSLAIVANIGTLPEIPQEKGSLVWFKIAEGTLVKKIEAEHIGDGFKHFGQTAEKIIYIHGLTNDRKTKNGLFYIYNKNTDHLENISAKWTNTYQDEILNIFIDQQFERIWMTAPSAGAVLVYNPLTKKIEKEFKRNRPRLLLPFKKSDRLYVTCAENDNRRFFSRANRQELEFQSKSFKLDNLSLHISPYRRK